VKVYNLTDVETPTLKQYGLVRATVVVGAQSVAPGASVVVEPKHELAARHHLEHLLSVGAVAIDEVPEKYVSAKDTPMKTALKYMDTPPAREDV
jgi:hypothetical protein